MSVVYLGSVNLLSMVPGLGTSLGGLQKAITSLDLLKQDKAGLIQSARSEVDSILNVYNQAKSLYDAGSQLLAQAEGVLSEARSIVTDLFGSIGGAGVGAYRFTGDVSSIGSELQAAMTAAGQTGQVTALILVASDGGSLTAMRKLFRMD